jgi:hypothetical protein
MTYGNTTTKTKMETVSRASSFMDPGESNMDPSWFLHTHPSQARDLTVEAAQVMGLTKALKSTSRNMPFTKIKTLLDSRSDRDILDGLKRVVSVSRFVGDLQF